MLVLTRKLKETIVIEGGITIHVLGIMGGKVRIGVHAPDRKVDRGEVFRRKQAIGDDPSEPSRS